MEVEQRLDNLEKKLDEFMKKFEHSEKKKTPVVKAESKNIPFEESFEKCKKGENYPCMYLPKSGKNKDHCCGLDAVLVENEDDDQVKLEGKIEEDYFHSLRCKNCKDKGRTANSISKKKCIEKIKGIDVGKTSDINDETLSFLAGTSKNLPSPTLAMSKKSLSKEIEIEHDDFFHLVLPFNNNNFVFEVSKNKGGTPCRKKTPALKGYIASKEIEKDTYEEEMEEKIPEKIIKELKGVKKFKFDEENIIKEKKKQPVIPTVSKEEDEDDDSSLKDSDLSDILEGLNVE